MDPEIKALVVVLLQGQAKTDEMIGKTASLIGDLNERVSKFVAITREHGNGKAH